MSESIQTILVPIDFSDESLRSFRYVAETARPGARIVVMTVIEDRFPYPELFAVDHPNEEFYKFMRHKALDHMSGLASDEHEVEKVVVRGRPADGILEVADQLDASLIAMARRGSGPVRAKIMGSVTEAVVRRAERPVVVLPPSPTD